MKQQQKEEPVTFVSACAIENDYIYLVSKPDRLDDEDEFSRMFFYDAQSRTSPWVHHDLADWSVISVCPVRKTTVAPRNYCALSKHGEIEFTWVGGSRIERISGAGLKRDEPPFFGYVNAIRQIGDELYVAGSGGQVYRRNGGQWTHMAEQFKKPAVVLPSAQSAAELDIGVHEFSDIDGLSEQDIYVVGGNGEIHHYNGETWKTCEADTRKPLNCVRAVSGNEVWVCGFGGTLLRGNHSDGFSAAGSCSEILIFSSLGVLNGTVYLASNKGVFHLCEDGVIRRVRTGMSPEVDDANVIDVRDGVLWSIGYKDIVSFNGHAWARLSHPDNTR